MEPGGWDVTVLQDGHGFFGPWSTLVAHQTDVCREEVPVTDQIDVEHLIHDQESILMMVHPFHSGYICERRPDVAAQVVVDYLVELFVLQTMGKEIARLQSSEIIDDAVVELPLFLGFRMELPFIKVSWGQAPVEATIGRLLVLIDGRSLQLEVILCDLFFGTFRHLFTFDKIG